MGHTYRQSLWLRAGALSTCAIFIWTNVLFAQKANPSFWEERHNVVTQFTGGETLSSFRIERRSTAPGNSTATTPDGSATLTTDKSGNYNLLAQLPALQTSIAARAKNWNTSVPHLPMGAVRQAHHMEGQGEGIEERKLNGTGASPTILSSIAPYAEIKEVYPPSLPPTHKSLAPVFIIQDVHQHYEAQLNIANIINNIAEAQGTEDRNPKTEVRNLKTDGRSRSSVLGYRSSVVIGVEGAVGPFDFSPYRAYSDKQLTKDIADFFMQQGMIGGPEFFGITTPEDSQVRMVGVEDEKLYLANIQAFKDSLPLERQVKVEIEKRRAEVKVKKEKTFNTTLLELDKKRVTYHEGNLSLGEYLSNMYVILSNSEESHSLFRAQRGISSSLTTGDSSASPQNDSKPFRRYNAVFNLVEAYQIEKSLDISKLESERSQILSILTEKLPKPTLDEILNSALAYRTGNITYAQFYAYFKETSKSAGINFSQFQEMDKYVRYVQLADSIDKNKLFSEIEQLEKHLENKLTKTEEEKELLQESKYLELSKKLASFSLTPEEWNSYMSLRADMVVAGFSLRTSNERKLQLANLNARRLKPATTKLDENYLNKKSRPNGLNGLNELNELSLSSFEQFYETALKRNEVLISNLLRQVKNETDKGKEQGSRRLQPAHSMERRINPATTNLPALNSNSSFSTFTSTCRISVLIAGGFHTDGITHLLKQKNIPYVVLAPNITKVEEGQKSLDIIARAKTPLEKLFAGEKIFLQSPRYFGKPVEGFTTPDSFNGAYAALETALSENLEQRKNEANRIPGQRFKTLKATRKIFGLFSVIRVQLKKLSTNKNISLTVIKTDNSPELVEGLPSHRQIVHKSKKVLSGKIGNWWVSIWAEPEPYLVIASMVAITAIMAKFVLEATLQEIGLAIIIATPITFFINKLFKKLLPNYTIKIQLPFKNLIMATGHGMTGLFSQIMLSTSQKDQQGAQQSNTKDRNGPMSASPKADYRLRKMVEHSALTPEQLSTLTLQEQWEAAKTKWPLGPLNYAPGSIREAGLTDEAGNPITTDFFGNYPNWIYSLTHKETHETIYVGPDDVETLFPDPESRNQIRNMRAQKENDIKSAKEQILNLRMLQALLGLTGEEITWAFPSTDRIGDAQIMQVKEATQQLEKIWRQRMPNISLNQGQQILKELAAVVRFFTSQPHTTVMSRTDLNRLSRILSQLASGDTITVTEQEFILNLHQKLLRLQSQFQLQFQRESAGWAARKPTTVTPLLEPKTPAYHANLWIANWLANSILEHKGWKPLILDLGANRSVFWRTFKDVLGDHDPDGSIAGAVIDLENDKEIYDLADNPNRILADVAVLPRFQAVTDNAVLTLVEEPHAFDIVIASFVLDQLTSKQLTASLAAIERLLAESPNPKQYQLREENLEKFPLLIIASPEQSPIAGSDLDKVIQKIAGYTVVVQQYLLVNPLTRATRQRILETYGPEQLAIVEQATAKPFHIAVYAKTAPADGQKLATATIRQLRKGSPRIHREGTEEPPPERELNVYQLAMLADILPMLRQEGVFETKAQTIINRTTIESDPYYADFEDRLAALIHGQPYMTKPEQQRLRTILALWDTQKAAFLSDYDVQFVMERPRETKDKRKMVTSAALDKLNLHPHVMYQIDIQHSKALDSERRRVEAERLSLTRGRLTDADDRYIETMVQRKEREFRFKAYTLWDLYQLEESYRVERSQESVFQTTRPQAALVRQVVKYVQDIFEIEPTQTELPSQVIMGKAIGVSETPIRVNMTAILNALKRTGDRRIIQAVDTWEAEQAKRAEQERGTFNLDAVVEYIKELFQKEPERTVLPSRMAMGKMIGVSKRTIQDNKTAILTALKQTGNERIIQAVDAWEAEQAKRAEQEQGTFNLDAVVEYVKEVFQREPERTVLPSHMAMGKAIGASKFPIQNNLTAILNALRQTRDEQIIQAVDIWKAEQAKRAEQERGTFNLDAVVEYVKEVFQREPKRTVLPSQIKMGEAIKVSFGPILNNMTVILTALKQTGNERIIQAVDIWEAEQAKRAEQERGTFNLDAVVEYVKELFQKEPERTVLPSQMAMAKAIGVSHSTLHPYNTVIFNALKQTGNKRIIQAVDIWEAEQAKRAEQERGTFNLDAVVEYVKELFQKEPERTVLPSQMAMAKAIGVSGPIISRNMITISNTLKRTGDTRIIQAVRIWEQTSKQVGIEKPTQQNDKDKSRGGGVIRWLQRLVIGKSPNKQEELAYRTKTAPKIEEALVMKLALAAATGTSYGLGFDIGLALLIGNAVMRIGFVLAHIFPKSLRAPPDDIAAAVKIASINLFVTSIPVLFAFFFNLPAILTVFITSTSILPAIAYHKAINAGTKASKQSGKNFSIKFQMPKLKLLELPIQQLDTGVGATFPKGRERFASTNNVNLLDLGALSPIRLAKRQGEQTMTEVEAKSTQPKHVPGNDNAQTLISSFIKVATVEQKVEPEQEIIAATVNYNKGAVSEIDNTPFLQRQIIGEINYNREFTDKFLYTFFENNDDRSSPRTLQALRPFLAQVVNAQRYSWTSYNSPYKAKYNTLKTIYEKIERKMPRDPGYRLKLVSEIENTLRSFDKYELESLMAEIVQAAVSNFEHAVKYNTEIAILLEHISPFNIQYVINNPSPAAIDKDNHVLELNLFAFLNTSHLHNHLAERTLKTQLRKFAVKPVVDEILTQSGSDAPENILTDILLILADDKDINMRWSFGNRKIIARNRKVNVGNIDEQDVNKRRSGGNRKVKSSNTHEIVGTQGNYIDQLQSNGARQYATLIRKLSQTPDMPEKIRLIYDYLKDNFDLAETYNLHPAHPVSLDKVIEFLSENPRILDRIELAYQDLRQTRPAPPGEPSPTTGADEPSTPAIHDDRPVEKETVREVEHLKMKDREKKPNRVPDYAIPYVVREERKETATNDEERTSKQQPVRTSIEPRPEYRTPHRGEDYYLKQIREIIPLLENKNEVKRLRIFLGQIFPWYLVARADHADGINLRNAVSLALARTVPLTSNDHGFANDINSLMDAVSPAEIRQLATKFRNNLYLINSGTYFGVDLASAREGTGMVNVLYATAHKISKRRFFRAYNRNPQIGEELPIYYLGRRLDGLDKEMNAFGFTWRGDIFGAVIRDAIVYYVYHRLLSIIQNKPYLIGPKYKIHPLTNTVSAAIKRELATDSKREIIRKTEQITTIHELQYTVDELLGRIIDTASTETSAYLASIALSESPSLALNKVIELYTDPFAAFFSYSHYQAAARIMERLQSHLGIIAIGDGQDIANAILAKVLELPDGELADLAKTIHEELFGQNALLRLEPFTVEEPSSVKAKEGKEVAAAAPEEIAPQTAEQQVVSVTYKIAWQKAFKYLSFIAAVILILFTFIRNINEVFDKTSPRAPPTTQPAPEPNMPSLPKKPDTTVAIIVLPGNNLTHIGDRYYGNASPEIAELIAEHNGISDPDTIFTWKRLSLPPKLEHIVEKGESFGNIANRYYIFIEDLEQMNPGISDYARINPGHRIIVAVRTSKLSDKVEILRSILPFIFPISLIAGTIMGAALIGDPKIIGNLAGIIMINGDWKDILMAYPGIDFGVGTLFGLFNLSTMAFSMMMTRSGGSRGKGNAQSTGLLRQVLRLAIPSLLVGNIVGFLVLYWAIPYPWNQIAMFGSVILTFGLGFLLKRLFRKGPTQIEQPASSPSSPQIRDAPFLESLSITFLTALSAASKTIFEEITRHTQMVINEVDALVGSGLEFIPDVFERKILPLLQEMEGLLERHQQLRHEIRQVINQVRSIFERASLIDQLNLFEQTLNEFDRMANEMEQSTLISILTYLSGKVTGLEGEFLRLSEQVQTFFDETTSLSTTELVLQLNEFESQFITFKEKFTQLSEIQDSYYNEIIRIGKKFHDTETYLSTLELETNWRQVKQSMESQINSMQQNLDTIRKLRKRMDDADKPRDGGVIRLLQQLVIGGSPNKQEELAYRTETAPKIEEALVMKLALVSAAAISYGFGVDIGLALLIGNATLRIGFVLAHMFPKSLRAPPEDVTAAIRIAAVNSLITSIPILVSLIFNSPAVLTIILASTSIFPAIAYHKAVNAGNKAPKQSWKNFSIKFQMPKLKWLELPIQQLDTGVGATFPKGRERFASSNNVNRYLDLSALSPIRLAKNQGEQTLTTGEETGLNMAAGQQDTMLTPKKVLDGRTWLSQNTPGLEGRTLVETTMEMALSENMLKILEKTLSPDEMRAVAMASSVGGIGPLLKERITAMSELGANVIGTSLLYDKVWFQKIVDDDDYPPNNGRKKLVLEKIDVGKYLRNNREIFDDAGELDIDMYDGETVTVKVLKTKPGMYGKGTVYFFDVPEIAETIGGRANVVYPGDKDLAMKKEEMRFNQSWILGRGTLALMKKLNQQPDIMIMSETPAMFVHHRMFQDKFTKDNFFKDTKYIFNDHTPLKYAHPSWDRERLAKIKVTPFYYENLPPVWNEDGTVDATAMIVNAADGAYGVSEKHGNVMRAMDALKQFASKITHITNGVSQAYWPQDEFKNPNGLQNITNTKLLAIKERRRHQLSRWLAERQGLGNEWANKIIDGGNPVGIWIRRIVEYKRLERFMDILENTRMKEAFLNTGIIMVLGGRVHQDDTYGINQFNRLQTLYQIEPRLRELVIFLENHNYWEAPHLFQGADLAIMLADDGREAAATGFQKTLMNGALIIASEDGAPRESVTFYDGANVNEANGFKVPYTENNTPSAEGLLTALETFGDVFKDKTIYGKMAHNALAQTKRVSVEKTAKDMLKYFADISANHDEKIAAFNTGAKIANEIIATVSGNGKYGKGSALSPNAAWKILRLFNDSALPFVWKYEEWGVITTSHQSAKGFLDSLRQIMNLGSIGEWSLLFHSHRSERGDVLDYMDDITKHVIKETIRQLGPNYSQSPIIGILIETKKAIRELGKQLRQTQESRERLLLNYKAAGLAKTITHFITDMIDESLEHKRTAKFVERVIRNTNERMSPTANNSIPENKDRIGQDDIIGQSITLLNKDNKHFGRDLTITSNHENNGHVLQNGSDAIFKHFGAQEISEIEIQLLPSFVNDPKFTTEFPPIKFHIPTKHFDEMKDAGWDVDKIKVPLQKTLEAYITSVIGGITEKQINNLIKTPIFFAITDTSPHLMADHTANHRIFMNRALLELKKSGGLNSKIADVHFASALSHELLHEIARQGSKKLKEKLEEKLSAVDLQILAALLNDENIPPATYQKSVSQILNHFLVSTILRQLALNTLPDAVESFLNSRLVLPEPVLNQVTRIGRLYDLQTEKDKDNFIKQAINIILKKGQGADYNTKFRELIRLSRQEPFKLNWKEDTARQAHKTINDFINESYKTSEQPMDVIGLFDPPYYEDGFNSIQPTLERIAKIAKEQKRPVILILENNRNPSYINQDLHEPGKAQAIRAIRDNPEKKKEVFEKIFNSYNGEINKLLKRRRLITNISVTRESQYLRQLENFIEKHPEMEITWEDPSYKGWDAAIEGYILDNAANTALDQRDINTYVSKLDHRTQFISAEWESRDAALTKPIDGQLDKIKTRFSERKRSPNPIVVILRHPVHHKMLDNMDTKLYRTFRALTYGLEPETSRPLEWIAYNRMVKERPLTHVELTYLQTQEDYGAGLVYMAGVPEEIKSIETFQAKMHPYMTGKLHDKYHEYYDKNIDALYNITPPVLPYIQSASPAKPDGVYLGFGLGEAVAKFGYTTVLLTVIAAILGFIPGAILFPSVGGIIGAFAGSAIFTFAIQPHLAQVKIRDIVRKIKEADKRAIENGNPSGGNGKPVAENIRKAILEELKKEMVRKKLEEMFPGIKTDLTTAFDRNVMRQIEKRGNEKLKNLLSAHNWIEFIRLFSPEQPSTIIQSNTNIDKKTLTRLLPYLTHEQLIGAMNAIDELNEQERNWIPAKRHAGMTTKRSDILNIGKTLFSMQGAANKAAKLNNNKTRSGIQMTLKKTMAAFQGLAAVIAPDTRLSSKDTRALKKAMKSGGKFINNLAKAKVTDVENIAGNATDFRIYGFDVSDIHDRSQEDSITLAMMAEFIKSGKINGAIALVTNQPILNDTDKDEIKRKLAARGVSDDMLAKTYFGMITVTGRDLGDPNIMEPLFNIDSTMLYDRIRAETKEIGLSKDDNLPVDMFTETPLNFDLSWKKNIGLRIMAILSPVHAVQVERQAEGAMEKIRQMLRQA